MRLHLSSFTVRHPIVAFAVLAALLGRVLAPALVLAAGVDPDTVVQSLQQSKLPIAAVTLHLAQNPVGVAFFIPQQHQNPGTSASDPQNDQAVVAQQQIAQIVTYLTQQEEVPFVMMEGYTYGPIPSDQLSLVQNEMHDAKEFATALPELQSACSQNAAAQTCNKVLTEAQSMSQDINRAAVLQGGELDDKAAGATFTLYGGEDQSLLDQGAKIVRNNVYLTDRLSQLQGGTSGVMGGAMQAAPSQGGSTGLLQLLTALKSRGQQTQGVQASDLKTLESQNNPALTRAAQDLSTAVDGFDAALSQKQQINATHAQNLPSRQDNPYASVTDQAQLQQLLQQNNSQIQTTIVDARNSAAADNFAKGLTDTKSDNGIIIFGSGHSEGLIQDLNQKGITVVAIVPQEVGDPTTLSAVGAQNSSRMPTMGLPMMPSGAQGSMPQMGGMSNPVQMGMNPMMGGMNPLMQILGGGMRHAMMPQMSPMMGAMGSPMMPTMGGSMMGSMRRNPMMPRGMNPMMQMGGSMGNPLMSMGGMGNNPMMPTMPQMGGINPMMAQKAIHNPMMPY